MRYTIPGGRYPAAYDVITAAPHAFIAGCTGSGKSTMLHGLIYSLLARYSPATVHLAFIDLKRVELCMYRKVAHCIGYANTEVAALQLLDALHARMMERFTEMEKSGQTETEKPHIYLIFDEIGYFFARTGKQGVKALESIAMLGRAAHIHLVYACQNPRKSGPGAIPAGLLLNTPCRVALRCVDKLESRLILGIPGAELLPSFGDCIISTGVNLGRHSIPATPPVELRRVVEHWANPGRYSPPEPEPRNRRRWYRRLFK